MDEVEKRLEEEVLHLGSHKRMPTINYMNMTSSEYLTGDNASETSGTGVGLGTGSPQKYVAQILVGLGKENKKKSSKSSDSPSKKSNRSKSKSSSTSPSKQSRKGNCLKSNETKLRVPKSRQLPKVSDETLARLTK